MGSGPSQEELEGYALQYYEYALQHTCLFPDIGIDESLLKYSGTDSNAVLQSYSNDLAKAVPDYIQKLGASFAALSVVPNAVGLGALVISMILEIAIKSSTPAQVDSYSLLQRIFGEEKASAVRDTMSEYLKRHETFLNNDQQLQEELSRLEKQLSNHLTILRNSLLHDGQMSTRGLKIWINGASFHLQMLIHEARLNVQAGKPSSDFVNAIEAANGVYMRNLDTLVENYRTHKAKININWWATCNLACFNPVCYIESDKCYVLYPKTDPNDLCNFKLNKPFMNHVFSKYEPITGLKSHFLNTNNNLNSLIRQHDSFTLPSRT